MQKQKAYRASLLRFDSAGHAIFEVDGLLVVGPDAFPYGPMDVTRNLPLELYDAPAILANESDLACLRREYPNRTFYRAVGRGAQLVPTVP